MQDLTSPLSPELSALQVRALAPLAQVLGKATNAAPPKAQLGAALSKQKGHGLELHEVRPYHASDEVRHMDWRITARTGTPHSRVYTEEREHRSHLCISLSENAFFGTRTTFLSTRLVQLAALIGWRTQYKREAMGLSIQGQPSINTVKDWPLFSEKLATLTQVSNRYSVENTFGMPVPHHIKGCSILILSDQLNISEEGHNTLAQLARHNRVYWISVEDEQTFKLPPGRYTLKTPKQVSTSELSASNIEKTAQQYQLKQQELDAILVAMGIRRLVFDVNHSPISIAHQLLARGVIN